MDPQLDQNAASRVARVRSLFWEGESGERWRGEGCGRRGRAGHGWVGADAARALAAGWVWPLGRTQNGAPGGLSRAPRGQQCERGGGGTFPNKGRDENGEAIASLFFTFFFSVDGTRFFFGLFLPKEPSFDGAEA